MKTKLKLQSLLVALACAAGLQRGAAQGTAFTYQGSLNSGGGAANGNYDFSFVPYNDPQADNQVGLAQMNLAVAVTNGLFTTTLDFGPGPWNGQAVWLQIFVRTNGGGTFSPLMPRQALASAPYAIASLKAATANSVAAANVTGTVSLGQLPIAVVTNNNSDVLTLSGDFTGDFGGDGGGLVNANADTLNGLGAANFWQTGGNSVAPGQFLGSTNAQAVELWANNGRAFRLEPGPPGEGAPSVVGGSPVNFVSAAAAGGTDGGGGAATHVFSGFFTVHLTNSVTGAFGTVSGGGANTAGNLFATVAGGDGNIANGDTATVAGGAGNMASGDFSAAGGGDGNQATNTYATVPGGTANIAGGEYSFAAGQQALALHQGAFVWADSQNAAFASGANDQFCVRAQGGVQLASSTSLFCGSQTRQMLNLYSTSYGIGVQAGTLYSRANADFAWYLGGTHSDLITNAGGGTTLMVLNNSGLTVKGILASSSDRNQKEHFTPVDARTVLAKVSALPITQWNFKDDTATAHIGPMAQDFYAAFNVGSDDKHITTVDEGGVALAAIQGVNQKLEAAMQAKDAEIGSLQADNQLLQKRLTDLEKLVTRLAQQGHGP